MSNTAQINSATLNPAALMAYERAPVPDVVAAQAALAVPPAHEQVEGMLPPAGTPPAGVDADLYKEFLAFKASKSAAPAPAPAEQPQAEKPELAKVTAPEPSESVTLLDNASGHDPVMKSMLTVFDHGAKGLDRSRALGLALSRNDPSLVDVAYIREAGGDAAESLIEVAKSIVTHTAAAVASVEKEILTSAGGQAAWDAAAAAFNKSALPGMRAYVAAEMESGNRSRILAAAALVTEQAKGAGLVPTLGTHVTPGGGDNGNPSGAALSKADFKDELAKLNQRDRQYQTKADALMERRRRGINAGL